MVKWFCCGFCFLFFGGLFVAAFFIGVSIKVGVRGKVHHILEDVVVTVIASNDTSNGSSSSSSSSSSAVMVDRVLMAFKVWSRNANKRLGVRVWHMRIAAVYQGVELGRAYVLPAPFMLPPRNITRLQATVIISASQLALAEPDTASQLALAEPDTASRFRADIASADLLPLRIYVKVRANYRQVDGSWQSKLVDGGDIRADDKCDLRVSIRPSFTNTITHLQGRQCGWTLASYAPDASVQPTTPVRT